MKVLIIGSGGYMGRHLMDYLAALGIEAVGASSMSGSGIDPVSGLLPAEFSVPEGTSAVVYMAQSPMYRQVPEQASHVLAVNALSAVRAAVAARTAGVARFVYISTGTVYASTFSPIKETFPVRRDSWYVLSKLQGEEAVAMFSQDMEVIIVRPFGVYGPRQTGRLIPNLVESIRQSRPISLQMRNPADIDEGGLRISLCHIDDATHILTDIAVKGGVSCVNLAGNEPMSIREIAIEIGSHLGCAPLLEKAGTCRDTDLVADTGLLVRTYSPVFTAFRQGIGTVLA